MEVARGLKIALTESKRNVEPCASSGTDVFRGARSQARRLIRNVSSCIFASHYMAGKNGKRLWRSRAKYVTVENLKRWRPPVILFAV